MTVELGWAALGLLPIFALAWVLPKFERQFIVRRSDIMQPGVVQHPWLWRSIYFAIGVIGWAIAVSAGLWTESTGQLIASVVGGGLFFELVLLWVQVRNSRRKRAQGSAFD